jgi:hypothetical protein
MAWFDLKNADIYIRDGSNDSGTRTGAVNLLAGYMTGVSTMAVDAITGIIATGTRFTIAGQTTKYTVTGHTETMGNTTELVFTPGLTAGVSDNAVITFLQNELTIKVGEGNLTYSEKQNVEYKKDRGLLDTVRLGDEEPLDVSFEFWWEFLKASTGGTPTIEDVLKKRGEAADWVTTSDDECEPYCVDIVVLYTPPCSGEDAEEIVLREFRWESLNHDLKAGTISVSGKCNVKEAEVTRI